MVMIKPAEKKFKYHLGLLFPMIPQLPCTEISRWEQGKNACLQNDALQVLSRYRYMCCWCKWSPVDFFLIATCYFLLQITCWQKVETAEGESRVSMIKLGQKSTAVLHYFQYPPLAWFIMCLHTFTTSQWQMTNPLVMHMLYINLFRDSMMQKIAAQIPNGIKMQWHLHQILTDLKILQDAV